MTLENKFVTIVGLNHYDGNLQIGDVCTLVVEEDNMYDSNAIRVEHCGEKVGYVKKGKSVSRKYVLNKDIKDADIDVGYIRIEINRVDQYRARGIIRLIGRPVSEDERRDHIISNIKQLSVYAKEAKEEGNMADLAHFQSLLEKLIDAL